MSNQANLSGQVISLPKGGGTLSPAYGVTLTTLAEYIQNTFVQEILASFGTILLNGMEIFETFIRDYFAAGGQSARVRAGAQV